MTQLIKKIDPGLLSKAQQEYQATMTDTNRGVRDPVITPFATAMHLSGYVDYPERPNCCSKLRSCPSCPVGKGNYSTRYLLNGVVKWGCPHCLSISDY